MSWDENAPVVRGYRILGDRPKPDKRFNDDYLRPTSEAAHAHTKLRESVRVNGANCVGRAEEFSGDELPTDREAQMMCASCPSWEACDFYRLVAKPAFGVWAGRSYGEHLNDLIGEEG